jgi:hypothetical protein
MFKRQGPKLDTQTLGFKALTLETKLLELKGYLMEQPDFHTLQPARYALPPYLATVDAAWRAWVNPSALPDASGPESRALNPVVNPVHPFIAPPMAEAKRSVGRQSRANQVDRELQASQHEYDWLTNRLMEDWDVDGPTSDRIYNDLRWWMRRPNVPAFMRPVWKRLATCTEEKVIDWQGLRTEALKGETR